MDKYTGQVHSYVWYPADDTLLGFLSLFLTDSVLGLLPNHCYCNTQIFLHIIKLCSDSVDGTMNSALWREKFGRQFRSFTSD